MLGVGRLYGLEEFGDVGIVPEADEGLGLMAGDHDVVAFVLTAEFVEMRFVVGTSAVALDAHVSGGVVAVIPVEADGEIAAELLHHFRAQDGCPFLHEEGGEGEFQYGALHVDEHAHLHGDEVEDPGCVAHFLRQAAEFFHVGAAPDAFQVYGFGPERILGKGCGNGTEGLERQQLILIGIVVFYVVVYVPLPGQELFSQAHGHFKVAVVAAPDDQRGGEGFVHPQVHILTAADAEDALLRGNVQIYLYVV